MKFEVAGLSIVGGRSYQEDWWMASSPGGGQISAGDVRQNMQFEPGFIAVLTDGIGGGGHGELASKWVAQAVSKAFISGEDGGGEQLIKAMEMANRLLGNHKRKNREYGEMMGTTLVAAIFNEAEMTFLSIGDSPLYRFRNSEMHIVNELHERSVELDCGVSLDIVDWRAAVADRQRSAITSAITGAEIEEYQLATRRVEPGDIYVLASDGIEVLPPETLRRLVKLHSLRFGAAGIAAAILKMADHYGNEFRHARHDNATAVVVVCGADDDLATQAL